MQLKEFVEAAQQEIEQDIEKMAKARVKERLLEIRAAKKVLAKLEKQFTEMLEQDTDEVFLFKIINEKIEARKQPPGKGERVTTFG